MNIQWFPGHMTKTRRMIEENLKLVDCVLELRDARIPHSSKNSEIDKLVADKPRIILLNKADMADDGVNQSWILALENAILIDSLKGKGIEKIAPLAKKLLSEKIARDEAKGITRSLKLMVVGIPNVGKSAFINKFSGRAVAKVGDRPGVTREKQWVRLKNGFDLLDTPGILVPKFDDINAARKLAFTGAIKDEILDTHELAHYFMAYLRDNSPESITLRYKVGDIKNLEGWEIVDKIAKLRGMLVSGGEPDSLRASNVILDEFRSGKLGKISLEKPEDFNDEI